MLKHIFAAAVAAALIAAPVAPAMAQAKPETGKSETAKPGPQTAKTERKLTPQQQKMKDCGAKWQTYKKEKNVKGKAEYQKFLKTCLKA